MSELLNLLVLIIVFGVVMWLVNVYIPMPGAIKSLLNLLVLIVLVIYVLQFFGLVKPILPPIRLFR
ncbi:Thivi_2564 family membrane protein [Legionella fairfieldensis]|uniref:Thivi_2564 family membrane protein n=1 Tax=Legionella fairfieldensis TaxID=45064 RepID=UPI000A027E84|nr:Thivi_2564 family membrane protein [Legionella fairfieldensis]